MANKTKKRVVKDYTKQKIRTAKRLVLDNVTFDGCSTFKGVNTNGFELLEKVLSPKQVVTATYELHDLMRNVPRSWYFWMAIFHENDTERWIDSKLVTKEDLTINTLDAWLAPALAEFIEEVDTGDSKGYAWVGTPSINLDLLAGEDMFIERFTEMDVYNDKLRSDIYTSHMLDKLKKAEEADSNNEKSLEGKVDLNG